MNEAETRRSVVPKFSLSHLLAFTAMVAIGTAVGLAHRRNHFMLQQRDELLSLSSRLQVDNEDELAMSEMPRVASDFESWNVHVPSGREYELRLGMGPVFEMGIPPIVSSVRIPAGRHRVTLHTGDSPSEDFRYVVYVDGKQAMEKTMGRDWMPGGWSSASGMSWPREPQLSPAPLQLSAKSYKPNRDFGRRHYFSGQSDDYVTRNGYRLWIDLSDRTYPSASPFIGLVHDPQYQGIGLRDGFRYKPSSRPPYEWAFTRPSLDTNEPVLRVSAEFFASDRRILSSQTRPFQSWQLSNDARGENPLRWQLDPAQSVYSAYLHAKLKSGDVRQPVVEMKWDAARPDEVGLRLADTPANDGVTRWRLRILNGAEHLWRELQIGDRTIEAAKAMDTAAAKPPDGTVALDPGNSATADTRLQWQTDETLPLQILGRAQNRYAGMRLYRGLPVTLGIQIPAALQPAISATVLEEAPDAPGTPFAGGAVFGEIQIDLAGGGDWIWLQAESKK